MFVRKVRGRQLARYIALIYIILWILFIIYMVVRFEPNELLDIDLFLDHYLPLLQRHLLIQ